MRCVDCGAPARALVSHRGPMAWGELRSDYLCGRHAHRTRYWGGAYYGRETLREALEALLDSAGRPMSSRELQRALGLSGRRESAASVGAALCALWVRERVDRTADRPILWRSCE